MSLYRSLHLNCWIKVSEIFCCCFYPSIFFNTLTSEEFMGANDLWGMVNLNVRGMVGRIYIQNHYALLIYYTLNTTGGKPRNYYEIVLT